MFKNFYPLLGIFEALYVRGSLFHFSTALFPLLLYGGVSEGDGVDINSIDLSLVAKIDLLIYLVAGALIILRWKKNLVFASKSIWFYPFVIFVSFSYFWSSMPATTFKGVIYALGTTAFGVYVASRYTIKEQLNHLAWTLGTIMCLSIVFIVALPHYGIMGGIHEGAVRGIYEHKNVFSPMIVLSVIVFFLKALEARENKQLMWGFFIVSIALGVMSRSSTALGLMFVMLAFCIGFQVFRWRYEFLIMALLSILIVGVAGLLWFVEFGGSELLFGALGKDATLSSRTEIWAYVIDSIQRKPWLGYGLLGYWNGLDGPSAYVLRAMRVDVHYSHNGFIDTYLSFGLIGFSLFISNFILVIKKSLSLLRSSNAVEGFWPLLWMTYMILTNLTEGNIQELSSMTWALYTTVAFSLANINLKKTDYIV